MIYRINKSTLAQTCDYVKPNNKLQKLQHSLNIKYGNFIEEYDEQLLSIKHLTGNEKVLEIGGNIGRNSLIIASLLNDDSNLLVLESDAESSIKLKENRDNNNFKFHIEPSALSLRNLYQKGWACIESDKEIEGYTKVNIISLIEIRNKYKIDFDTLILDCEGAFYFILKDMPDILNNIKLIIVENDYTDPNHKGYVDNILLKNNFNVVDSVRGGFGVFYNNFYEVWKKTIN